MPRDPKSFSGSLARRRSSRMRSACGWVYLGIGAFRFCPPAREAGRSGWVMRGNDGGAWAPMLSYRHFFCPLGTQSLPSGQKNSHEIPCRGSGGTPPGVERFSRRVSHSETHAGRTVACGFSRDRHSGMGFALRDIRISEICGGLGGRPHERGGHHGRWCRSVRKRNGLVGILLHLTHLILYPQLNGSDATKCRPSVASHVALRPSVTRDTRKSEDSDLWRAKKTGGRGEVVSVVDVVSVDVGGAGWRGGRLWAMGGGFPGWSWSRTHVRGSEASLVQPGVSV